MHPLIHKAVEMVYHRCTLASSEGAPEKTLHAILITVACVLQHQGHGEEQLSNPLVTSHRNARDGGLQVVGLGRLASHARALN